MWAKWLQREPSEVLLRETAEFGALAKWLEMGPLDVLLRVTAELGSRGIWWEMGPPGVLLVPIAELAVSVKWLEVGLSYSLLRIPTAEVEACGSVPRWKPVRLAILCSSVRADTDDDVK